MTLADLHIHLLPGVDDGPQDWETSERMLEILTQSGVKLVAPTPHIYEPDWQDIDGRLIGLTELVTKAKRQGIQVVGAAEIWAIPDLPERWDKVPLLTYAGAGKYVLIEFDVNEMPLFTEWLLFQLKARGVTPIIAHPERYLWVQEDERNLYRLLANGALLQVSADTLLRPEIPMGKKARWLLQNGLADLLASDWHDPDSPYPLSLAVQKLESTLSVSELRKLVWEVPLKIVAGQNVQPAWQRSPLRLDIQAFIAGIERHSQGKRWWHFLNFLWTRKRG
ncbi:MAG: tyrosine-protein phosphatase [Candidatus Fervidibacter sp.]|uniref:tyrosine-protein phosphatase n=1 Tax=Candidatus Fervidibacter sp. TaxID=3100871 RepID=UPI00404AD1B3